ncbi:putative phosphoglycerate mutase [Halorubrum alkaliphilum]|uniref:Putative phosphoglycerate mutase n=1 Tax=Halorubrum alkaliphilum TaxID=261290 RepID=A0A8T4GCC5_9EURY|nr:histidine phosphatase family protein [Halorubrum alkaliphilum]MBP1921753.1 putative phosphoglycerate mutase [Halorubrum alkaliphilum]
MSTTLFVRHGTTTWNETDRIQGWAPVGLSETGRAEAATVATHLSAARDVDAVVSSDLARTVETAERIANATGVPVETDQRLRERDFGVYQGLSSATFFERFPKLDLLENGTDAAAYTPESGESWLTVRDRVHAAFDDLSDRPETTVVVTHVNPIRLVVGECRGLDVVSSLTELSAANCSVTEFTDGEIRRENDTEFL